MQYVTGFFLPFALLIFLVLTVSEHWREFTKHCSLGARGGLSSPVHSPIHIL